jgi:hypothetical protein
MSSQFEPDPLSVPFWEAAAERRLVVQRCRDCGSHQLYARPFCLQCYSDAIDWVEAAGTGTIHSATTVRLEVLPELQPPYDVALVVLDEGPRVLTNLPAGEARIGDRVRLDWRERDGLPPLPVFVPG